MSLDMIESYVDVGYILTGLLVLIIIFIILLIVQIVKSNKLAKRLSLFTSGKSGKNLEKIMYSKFSDIESIVNNEKGQNKDIKYIAERSTIAFNKIGLIKYNAFNEMTGNLSFALAILNDNNTGVIINSMHSREGCFTYAKEIINGESYLVLSEEEKEALDVAVTIKQNQIEELLDEVRATKTTAEINDNIKIVEKNNVKESPTPPTRIKKTDDLDRTPKPLDEASPRATIANEAHVHKITEDDRAKFAAENEETPLVSLTEVIKTKPRDKDIETEDDFQNTTLIEEIKTIPREQKAAIFSETSDVPLKEGIKTRPRAEVDKNFKPVDVQRKPKDDDEYKKKDYIVKSSDSNKVETIKSSTENDDNINFSSTSVSPTISDTEELPNTPKTVIKDTNATTANTTNVVPKRKPMPTTAPKFVTPKVATVNLNKPKDPGMRILPKNTYTQDVYSSLYNGEPTHDDSIITKSPDKQPNVNLTTSFSSDDDDFN